MTLDKIMPAIRKFISTALVVIFTAFFSWSAFAEGLDRGAMKVEFLYSVEYAGGRAEKLREPLDIFFDKAKKELYIADAAHRAIFVYDNNGMFLQKIDVNGKDGSPRLVAVDGKGRIHVGHLTSSRISLLDYRGEHIDVLELPGVADSTANRVQPASMAAGKEGEIYVLKNVGGMVRLDPDDKRHEEHGLSGDGPFPNVIFGMTIDNTGRFLFTDMRPYSVVAFDQQKKEFKRFGSPGVLYGQLDRPVGVAADDAGHIFVVSSVTNKVSCYDREGNFIEEFGGLGEAYGSFYMPGKIVSDGKDRIFVLENTLKRVQVFRVEFLK